MRNLYNLIGVSHAGPAFATDSFIYLSVNFEGFIARHCY